MNKAQIAVDTYKTWWDIYGFLKQNTTSMEEFNLVAQEARILFLQKIG